MALFRRQDNLAVVEPAAIPVPRSTIDGWTLSGTALADKLSTRTARGDLRELEILLHGISVHADTPYTYERAATLLERCGEHGAALSVCEAWLAHPASRWPEHGQQTRGVVRHTSRLRSRLGARQVPA